MLGLVGFTIRLICTCRDFSVIELHVYLYQKLFSAYSNFNQ